MDILSKKLNKYYQKLNNIDKSNNSIYQNKILYYNNLIIQYGGLEDAFRIIKENILKINKERRLKTVFFYLF